MTIENLKFNLHSDGTDVAVSSIEMTYGGEKFQATSRKSDFKALTLCTALWLVRYKTNNQSPNTVVGRLDATEQSFTVAAYNQVNSKRGKAASFLNQLFPSDSDDPLFSESKRSYSNRPLTSIFSVGKNKETCELRVRHDVINPDKIHIFLNDIELDLQAIVGLLEDYNLSVSENTPGSLPNTSEVVNSSEPIVKFILLNDFESSFESFALRKSMQNLESRFLEPMRTALADNVPRLEVLSAAKISSLTDGVGGKEHYTVTLDGGAYFKRHDFSVEMTRACLDMSTVATGPYSRVPRNGSSQLITTGLRLKNYYQKYGEGRRIVLCDDGIGTGKSLLQTIDILNQLSIRVDRVVVLLNPVGIPSVGVHDVNTLYESKGFHWLSERDLFWGVPRSGLSYINRGHNLTADAGVPYTLDLEMVESRIGITGKAAIAFREACLNINIEFWKELEQYHDSKLTVRSCPRLRIPIAGLSDPDTRIVSFLESINTPDYTRTPV